MPSHPSAPFQDQVHQLFLTHLLDTAMALLDEQGWQALTVSAVAERAGISRQRIYRELGDRQALAEALLTREVEGFLEQVRAAHRAHPDCPVNGITQAAQVTLEAGREHALLRSLLAGDTPALLSRVVGQTDTVLAPVLAAVTASARDHYGDRTDPGRLDRAVEVSVRLTLSHLLQPTGPVRAAVEQVHHTVAALLSTGAPS